MNRYKVYIYCNLGEVIETVEAVNLFWAGFNLHGVLSRRNDIKEIYDFMIEDITNVAVKQ